MVKKITNWEMLPSDKDTSFIDLFIILYYFPSKELETLL